MISIFGRAYNCQDQVMASLINICIYNYVIFSGKFRLRNFGNHGCGCIVLPHFDKDFGYDGGGSLN